MRIAGFVAFSALLVFTGCHRQSMPTVDFGIVEAGSVELAGENSLADIVRDPSGYWWLVDEHDDRLVRFSPSGERVDSVGGSGEGPREFRAPTAIVARSSGDLVVVDAALSRVTVFGPRDDLQHRAVRSFKSPGLTSHMFDGPGVDDVTVLVNEARMVHGPTFYTMQLRDGRLTDSLHIREELRRLYGNNRVDANFFGARLYRGGYLVAEMVPFTTVSVLDRSGNSTAWPIPQSPDADRTWLHAEADSMFRGAKASLPGGMRFDSATYVKKMLATSKPDMVNLELFEIGGDNCLWIVRHEGQAMVLQRVDSVGALKGRVRLTDRPKMLRSTPIGVVAVSQADDGVVRLREFTPGR
ncbi:MAG: hypothetical protein ABIR59_04470 [Gemmatimonadales bacterium]